MVRCARCARQLIWAFIAIFLTACGANIGALGLKLNSPPTIYDLTQRPREFAGKEITAQGYYLWKPGNPATSVLLPALSTADGTRDAQPIYASVACDASGQCQPTTDTVGEASTGAVWLESFPPEVAADLHRPGDSVWGVVEVTGLFEANGGYGPDGAYRYRMQVKQARALQKVERLVSAVKNEPLGAGKVTIFELAGNPAAYAGQRITTQGYYFWSPTTQGTFAERVEREKAEGSPEGIAPAPAGITMGMDGFPAEKSGELHVGPNSAYVWGLVEVTGTFGNGSFADGRYQQGIKVESVRVLEQVK